VDAAPNENNLIDLAKKPARRAHKKREVFVSQVSKQLRETDLIRKAYAALMCTLESNEYPGMQTDLNDLLADEDDDIGCEHISGIEEIESRLVGRALF